MHRRIAELVGPAPVTVQLTEPVRAAATLMRDADVGSVLVLDGQRLLGIVTDRDLVVRAVAEGADPDDVPVGEVTTASPVTVTPDDDPQRALALMREHGIRRIAVVKEGEPVGVVSLGDLAMDGDQNSALAAISTQPPTM